MDDNLRFLFSLDKDKFIIWWSTSINLQCAFFRKPDDIDIMCDYNLYYNNIIGKEKEYNFTIDSSNYQIENIFVLNFKDGTKIDIMIKHFLNFKSTIKKNWYYLLSINDIVKFKLDLIKNDLSKSLNHKNKHIKDIFWIYENYDFHNK